MTNSSTENKRKPGREKGCAKTGGRAKGTLNKKSLWLRDQLESVNFNWAIEFKDSMTIQDYERARILVDLLPYLNPKIEPRKIDEDESEDSTIFEPLVIHHVVKEG